jgi:hypothetical protein
VTVIRAAVAGIADNRSRSNHERRQYALEESPRWDWLDDGTIRAAVLCRSSAEDCSFGGR